MEYLLPVYAGQASIPETIITHVGIFRLFKHYSNEEKQEQVKEQLRMQAQSCRQNVDMTLTRLPFNLPSTLDCVLALYQAVGCHCTLKTPSPRLLSSQERNRKASVFRLDFGS